MSNITLLKLRLRETCANLTEMRSKHQKAQRRCHALQKDLDAARKENESIKNSESETQLKIRKFQQIIAEQLIEIRDIKVMLYFGHFYFYDFYTINFYTIKFFIGTFGRITKSIQLGSQRNNRFVFGPINRFFNGRLFE